MAAPSVRLAVIGMGKLGGGELNYSSDVDVMFVHEGDRRTPNARPRSVLATMTRPSPEGIVFRTDADLRPEGRAGRVEPNARQLHERTGNGGPNWELQALLKATPVAGDEELGDAFMARGGRSYGRRSSIPTRCAKRGR